jgi:hypothetical protein
MHYLSLLITEADSIHKNKKSGEEVDYADMVIYLNIATKSTECHLSATTKSTCQKIIEF